ncbi:MAG: alpha/beta hydrolase [Hyphomicrobiaceae bacterium]
MDIDWRGRFVETDDLKIHYVRAGTGRQVILLHGWPEFARSWMHNMPALADHFDVIAPEFRGFGETVPKRGRQVGGTPPQLLAQDLKAFIDALGLGVVDIVSHDVGSFVAQTFAHAYPASVRRLFFFNCAYPGIGTRWGEAGNFPELWYQQFHQKDFASVLVGSSREATRIYFNHFLTHWSHQKQAFTPYLEEWVDNFSRPGNIQGGFDWYVGVAAFRRRMMREGALAVPKIKAPAFVLWGRHDPVLQFAWSDKIADYFDTVTLECAGDAGHFVHFEVPELANRRMIQFLG